MNRLTNIADAGSVTLYQDQLQAIRKALVIGLAALGEIEIKENQFDLSKHSSTPWPDEAKPVHPTGCSHTVAIFAEALAYAEAP